MARKAKAEEPKFQVYRDSGEKDGHGWRFNASARCLGTVTKNLYTGDYSIAGAYEEKHFVIERKGSAAELAGNLTNEEKWDDFRQELERLEDFRWPYVLCEFSLAQLAAFPHGSAIPRSRWKTMRIRGPYLLRLVCEIEMKYKTRFHFCGSADAAHDMALCLFKRVSDACPPSTKQ